jgi:hypothetical protein
MDGANSVTGVVPSGGVCGGRMLLSSVISGKSTGC